MIDARALAPPEPFVLTMEALDVLGRVEKLLLILNWEAHPLNRALERDGYAHQAGRKRPGRQYGAPFAGRHPGSWCDHVRRAFPGAFLTGRPLLYGLAVFQQTPDQLAWFGRGFCGHGAGRCSGP